MGRWPQGYSVLWYFDASNLAPSDAAALLSAIAAGVRSWMGVCGVTIAQVDDPSHADVVIRLVADLSADPTVPPGPNQSLWAQGTELGLTDEPVAGHATPLLMRLDPNASALPGGAWTVQALQDVAMHEFGHALGFDHAPDGVESCMSAYLNLRVSSQTPYDVQVAQAIYGRPLSPPAASPTVASTPPAVVPTPPPAPTPGASSMNPFLILAETGALKLLHDELAAGAAGDVAIRSVLTAIEAQLSNPIVRAIVTDVLTAVVNAAEAAVAAA